MIKLKNNAISYTLYRIFYKLTLARDGDTLIA